MVASEACVYVSGVTVLLNSALDYERTHQVALYTLFRKSCLPETLLGISSPMEVGWEPENQLFDLSVSSDSDRVLIEIKMWSSLSADQFRRQTEHLSKNGSRAAYILLGTSWMESVPDKARCNVKTYYYSLYWQLQQKLGGLDTAIYTGNNRGGQVHIISNMDRPRTTCQGTPVEILCEFVNGRLCIKFCADCKDPDMKRAVRESVRHAVRQHLESKLSYPIVDSGCLGQYMTACHVDYEFSRVDQLDESCTLFREVSAALPDIAASL
jgi:hypothetical protein